MTEEEWLACANPGRILAFRRRASDRKLRLAACACCRHVSYLCIDEGKRAVEVAEGYADGENGHDELVAARLALEPYTKAGPEYVPWLVTAETAHEAASEVMWAVPVYAAQAVEISIEASGPGPESDFGTPDEARSEAKAYCVTILRDIFGNPFHHVSINPAWLTSTVLALARGIYDDRAFDCLPILADALQDAGCENPDILTHLRGDGPHVRGCWALDLVLGKQ